MINLPNPEYTSVEGMGRLLIEYYGGSLEWGTKVRRMSNAQVYAIYNRLYKAQKAIPKSVEVLSHGDEESIAQCHFKAVELQQMRVHFTCHSCGCIFEVAKDELDIESVLDYELGEEVVYSGICPECCSEVRSV